MTLPLLFRAAAEGALPGPFNPSTALAIWTVVIFAITLFVLQKFLFPALLGWNVEREQRIAAQLAEAKQLHADAEAALAEQRQLLADARGEAQSIIADARTAADRERAMAVEKTRAEQDELLARARHEIEAERDRAKADLRREAVDIAIAAAGKVVEQRLDADADRRMVEEFLGQIGTRA